MVYGTPWTLKIELSLAMMKLHVPSCNPAVADLSSSGV